MSDRRGRSERAAAVATAAPPPARLVRPLGQGAALQHWVRLARRLEAPHAFVVEGARGSGKTVVLRWLAAALSCPSEMDETEPCGVCRTCCRIAAGVFPDVHLVARAKDESDKTKENSFYVIKIDQVRAAQERLLRHAVEGRARVLVVADADCMEEAAQNALLKTLEEPGAATFLLLEAGCPERLRATVRSRAQRLRVVPLDDDTILRELGQRIPVRSPEFPRAVAVAGGSLGLALQACTERAVQLHDLVLGVLAANKGLRPVATARAVLTGQRDRVQEMESARTFLWLLRAEVRRGFQALAAGEAATYPALIAEPWTTWLELTLAAERDLDLLIPPEQVLTACLVGFVQA